MGVKSGDTLKTATNGTLLLPAELLETLGVQAGGSVEYSFQKGEIKLVSRAAKLRELFGIFKPESPKSQVKPQKPPPVAPETQGELLVELSLAPSTSEMGL